jgi:DNA-binding MarR family transcriptional regulator
MSKNEVQSQPLEELVTYRLMQLADTVLRAASEAYGARFGVTITEVRLLAVISAHQPVLANEITRRTGLDKGWVSRSLATLLKRGLVRRTSDPEDKRVAPVVLTSGGKRLVERMAPYAATRHRKLLAGLEENEVYRLLDVLQDRADEMLDSPERQGRLVRLA